MSENQKGRWLPLYLKICKECEQRLPTVFQQI